MARLYSTAQSIGHHLYAIADTQDRDSHFKDFLFQSGSAFLINTAGTTGENNTDGREFPDLLQGHIVGMDFTVHIAFPHSACDELIVLTAEIQNKDLLIFHTLPCLSIWIQYFPLFLHFLREKARFLPRFQILCAFYTKCSGHTGIRLCHLSGIRRKNREFSLEIPL